VATTTKAEEDAEREADVAGQVVNHPRDVETEEVRRRESNSALGPLSMMQEMRVLIY
jgi:hypothetical protein